MPSGSQPPSPIPFREALRVWVRVALLSFGGPAGQMAVMHRILVEEKRWISENRFLHALNFTMLLPGPEAQQLATYVGWLLHRARGGLAAGILFILPGFIAILVLSTIYAFYQQVPLVTALFFGLKPAVVAIVAQALLRIGRRALTHPAQWVLAGSAFVGIFFFAVPFPIIILAAALTGLAAGRWRPGLLPTGTAPEAGTRGENGPPPVIGDDTPVHTPPSLGRALRVAALCLPLWFGPPLLTALMLGPGHILVAEAIFFSKAAVVTFGGAYAVLAYIAQQAVEFYGWLQPGEMLDGLGMAETTPGPLIMVVQFVGYLGAFRAPEPFSPLMAGIAASCMVTWVTFVPCFLWIFLGAPYVETLRQKKIFSTALAAITAAVVGVILNLTLWFAIHTLFGEVAELARGPLQIPIPRPDTLNLPALLIAIGAFIAIFRLRAGIVTVLVGGAAAGVLLFLLGVGVGVG
jgi:chromate transporter